MINTTTIDELLDVSKKDMNVDLCDMEVFTRMQQNEIEFRTRKLTW